MVCTIRFLYNVTVGLTLKLTVYINGMYHKVPIKCHCGPNIEVNGIYKWYVL